MKTPLTAVRIDPALIELVRRRYRFAPEANTATLIRFAVALAGGVADPGGVARAPIGAPRTRGAEA